MRFKLVARAVLMMLVALIAVPATTSAQTPAAAGAGQVALYNAQQAVLVRDGRAIVDLFLEANEDPFLERSSDEVRGALDSVTFDRLLESLQSNRLTMDFPATGGQLGGHYSGGDSISGFYITDEESSNFRLTAEEEQTGEVPTGRWTGTIRKDEIEFSVVFSGTADSLNATIDVPAMQIEGSPLENVTFTTEQPIGEILASQALPISPSLRIYAELREWGPSRLLISTVLDASGTIQRFRFSPVLMDLPEDDLDRPGDGEPTYFVPASVPLFVYWAGQDELPSNHTGSPAQSNGYEFMVWRDGSIYSGDGARNEDYHIWDMPVLAPAAGTVVAVESGVADHAPGEAPAAADMPDAVTEAGNHVVIQVAPDEWVVLAHLQQGSVQVNVGDQVQPGDQIARVGNSGSASEPMLHMHAQSIADLNAPAGSAERLVLSDYIADGSTSVPFGLPARGQFVALPATPSE